MLPQQLQRNDWQIALNNKKKKYRKRRSDVNVHDMIKVFTSLISFSSND